MRSRAPFHSFVSPKYTKEMIQTPYPSIHLNLTLQTPSDHNLKDSAPSTWSQSSKYQGIKFHSVLDGTRAYFHYAHLSACMNAWYASSSGTHLPPWEVLHEKHDMHYEKHFTKAIKLLASLFLREWRLNNARISNFLLYWRQYTKDATRSTPEKPQEAD